METILDLENGARFFRADLHIHSFGASHDVHDKSATAANIVQTAASESLGLIAIADHNEIGNVAAAVEAARATSLLVIPAVELSTPDGHLLCYLPDVASLERFYARLDISQRGTPDSHCENAMLKCLDELESLKGFAVLAHLDGPGGLEQRHPGPSPHKKNIICHAALLGIELKDSASDIFYSRTDSDPNRVGVAKERTERLKLGTEQYLARVLNSDAHSLSALGRNAAGAKKLTRFKMNGLSFESLRIAMEEADARVRLEDEIPATIPIIRGVRFIGGFLDSQAIHFSKNLNCVIGGRGTGKSTTFEAIRCLTQQPSGSDVIDSEVWPDEISMLVQDEAGAMHLLRREKHGDVENGEDEHAAPITFEVECYGQGETHAISQRAKDDPSALLSYLDRFVRIGAEAREEDEVRDALLASQTAIEKATTYVAQLPQAQRSLSVVQQQIATFEKAKVRDIIRLQRTVQQERQAQLAIKQSLDAIGKAVSQADLAEQIEAIESACDAETLVVGTVEFTSIRAGAQQLAHVVSSTEQTLTQAASELAGLAKTQLASWKTKEQATLRTIEEKKRELESQGIRVDMAYLSKLTEDEARWKGDVAALETWQPHLAELQKQRKELLKQRWKLRERIANKRSAFAKKASTALAESLLDLSVNLKFRSNAWSPEAKSIIVEAMAWRTVQVQRADALVEQLTVPLLLDAVVRKQTKVIEALTTREGVKIFDKNEALRVVTRLAEPAIRWRLERCAVSDRPQLTVTKEIMAADGVRHFLTKDFRYLSLGQQQSVLLSLMLSADSSVPLLIDQPEDNLDGEFIYKSIVPVLRRAKERRQVIVVTHNANAAVLGDAELIVALRATNEKGMISTRGSIDDSATRDAACAILEGSSEAFGRRARLYGR